MICIEEAQSRDRTKRVVQIHKLSLDCASPIQIIANLTVDCIVFL